MVFLAARRPVNSTVGHLFVTPTETLKQRSQTHWRRTLILGSSVFVFSVLSGTCMMFWREYGTLFRVPADAAHRLLVQATLGPLYMAFAFLLPVTIPVLFVLTVLVYIGSRMARIWFSVLAFLLMGVYWLWLVKLIADGAID